MADISIREAVRAALREELLADERAFLMGEDIGAFGGPYGVTRGFLEEFGPERIRDTPISEQAVVGCGIGAAMAGQRPIVEVMGLNCLLAIDQIVNNAAKLHYMSGGQVSVPIVIRTTIDGGTGLGPQHSNHLAGWHAHVPGLKVACPSNPRDAKGLLRAALRDENPVIFVEHAAIYDLRGEVPEGDYEVRLGEAHVARPGKDVTIAAYSAALHQALRAAETLAEHGVAVEVIDLRTLRPLDIGALVESVEKTRRCVVVENDWRFGGFAAEVAAELQERCFHRLIAPVSRVCGADVPMPYARKLETAALPSEQTIVAAVLAMF